MASETEQIPDEMTIDEASEFWDTHSFADYPSKVVKMEFLPEAKTALGSTLRRPEKNS